MNFFFDLSIMKQKRNLRKICVQLLLMAFVLYPKIISKMLSTNLVSSQKTSDARCCQFLFLFHFFLPFLGGRRLELFIQDPIVQKVRNLKYNSGKRHQQKQLKTLLKLVLSQALYVLTSFISAEIMRKYLSAELRHKIILNSCYQIGKNPQMKAVLIFLHFPWAG